MSKYYTDQNSISNLQYKDPLIDIVEITKQFKVGSNNQEVLKNINLKIFPSDFVIIYGASGSGKSTLLNIITGLEMPTRGQVFIRNDDLYSRDENTRAKFRGSNFGIVYQMPYWIKSLSVIDNVALPVLLNGAEPKRARNKAMSSLEYVGMAEYAKYAPTELSGGQQQKVGIARAIVTNPRIIVADEPTGNLDSKSAKDIMELFKFLNREKKRTIIMVTHNMAYLVYGNRRVGMKDGEISENNIVENLDDVIEFIQPGIIHAKHEE